MVGADGENLVVGATGRADRIELLDALRGFALFGILLANILYWSGWGVMTEEQRIVFAGAEAVTWQYRFHHLLGRELINGIPRASVF